MLAACVSPSTSSVPILEAGSCIFIHNIRSCLQYKYPITDPMKQRNLSCGCVWLFGSFVCRLGRNYEKKTAAAHCVSVTWRAERRRERSGAVCCLADSEPSSRRVASLRGPTLSARAAVHAASIGTNWSRKYIAFNEGGSSCASPHEVNGVCVT